MRKLKEDIWDHLDSRLAKEASTDQENVLPLKSKVSKTISFQDMLKDMSTTQSQKEASLSFYFICLLHLANEKELKIKNTPSGDMSDLLVTRDI